MYKRSENVASRVLDGEAVLVTPSDGGVKVLNGCGSRIWELIDGTRSIEQIVEVIVSEYDVKRETAAEDIDSFIEELKKRTLIELNG